MPPNQGILNVTHHRLNPSGSTGDRFTNRTDGHAIAEAVIRWLPIAAARVRARVWSCGICGGQSGAGEGFLRVLPFLLTILVPPNAPYSSIVRGWYSGPISGRRTK
jgi:hypothetical protein